MTKKVWDIEKKQFQRGMYVKEVYSLKNPN